MKINLEVDNDEIELDRPIPSKALVASDGNGEGFVLQYTGSHITIEICEVGVSRSDLIDLGLDGAPLGLSIWEGNYVHRIAYENEVDTYLEGVFRNLTPEEWELLKNKSYLWPDE
jgi:hypothetical protein